MRVLIMEQNPPGAASRSLWRILPARVRYLSHQVLVWCLRPLRERLIRDLSAHVEVEGIPTAVDLDAVNNGVITVEGVRLGVSDALALIARRAPRIRRRINADVRRLLVEPGKAATYVHPGTILLPSHVFEAPDIDAVASYIVHEAVHARIAKRGIRYWPDLRARIERRCLREQIAFLGELPGRADLVAFCEDYLYRRWQ